MRKTLLGGTLGLLVATAGCGGGGGGGGGGVPKPQALTPSTIQLLQFSALARTGDLTRVLAAFQSLVQAALDPDLADDLGVTIGPSTDPGDPPFTFDFSIPFDLDGNRSQDATLSGKVTFPSDPTGVLPPTSADLQWGLVGADGDVTGDGTFHLALGLTGDVEVSGDATIADARDGSTFDVSIDPLTPLRVRIPLILAPLVADGSSAIQVGGIEVDVSGCGHMRLTLPTPVGSTYVADVCFDSGSNEVCYQNATVNGNPVADACMQLLPSTTPGFVKVAVCAAFHTRVLRTFLDALRVSGDLTFGARGDLDGDGIREDVSIAPNTNLGGRYDWTVDGTSLSGEGHVYGFTDGETITITSASGGFIQGTLDDLLNLNPNRACHLLFQIHPGSTVRLGPDGDIVGRVNRFVVTVGNDYLSLFVQFLEGEGVDVAVDAGNLDGESYSRTGQFTLTIPGS